MRMRTLALLLIGGSSIAAAQNPAPQAPGPMGPPMPMAMQEGMGLPAAKMLLANSAELDLTDAQVVKLAAIARRGEARRRSMRSAMDSAGMRFRQPSDSNARRQFGERMRADMEKMRDQSRTDQRDAIATLTADQQAKAWEMISNRAMRARGGMPQGGAGGMRPGREMRRRDFGPGQQPRMRRPFRQPEGQ